MGEESGAIEADALPGLVLQTEDLGADFVRFDEGPLVRADFQPGPRQDPGRFGRLDGWKTRFRASNPTDREGVLVVQSLLDLFEGRGGAEEDLAAYGQEFEQNGQSNEPVSGQVGDETAAVVFEANGVFFCTVAWRYENVTAAVTTQAFDRQSALEAFALAQKQQRRIAAAAD